MCILFLLFYCSFYASLFCIVPPSYCLIVLSVCCLFGEIKKIGIFTSVIISARSCFLMEDNVCMCMRYS